VIGLLEEFQSLDGVGASGIVIGLLKEFQSLDVASEVNYLFFL